jgi:DNA replication protein DnaC
MNEYFNILERDGEEVVVLSPDGQKFYGSIEFDNRLLVSGIPERYWSYTYSDILDVPGNGSNKKIMTEHIRKIQYFIHCALKNKECINLYLYSQNYGSGKTSAMCVAGKELVRNKMKVKFILAGDLIDILMKTQGYGNNKDLVEQRDILLNQDVLLIDDIFDSNKSLLWSTENKGLIILEWDRFMRNATANNIKIIVTSNISIGGISGSFGPALSSLIMRDFMELHFEWSIARKRKTDMRRLMENDPDYKKWEAEVDL